jgi:excisionase family DNA binding protein
MHVGGELKTLYNTKQVAELLGVSETTVGVMATSGQIPRIKIGRLVRFDPVQLDEWLAQCASDTKSLSKDDPLGEARYRVGRRNPKRPVTFSLG